MSHFEFDDVFPVIERLIASEYRKRRDWASHRHLVEALQQDSQGMLLLKHASSFDSNWDEASWASNMVAWFSQQISIEAPPPKDRFDRKKVDRRWAYKPKGQPTRAEANSPITVFSWGYEGWGNSTKQLIQSVDAVEESNGFQHPVFIDIRIQRSVRAEGFRERAFEELLGPKRYVWMKSLGNMRIKTKTGPFIQIAEPLEVHRLLDLVLEAAVQHRRLIFFCGCKWPRVNGKIACHRTTVAALLRRAAAKRGVPIEIMEWPGGKPQQLEVKVTRPAFEAAKKGNASVPIKVNDDLAVLAGLPWGSTVSFRCGNDVLHRIVGPATFRAGKWALPVHESSTDENDNDRHERDVAKFRRSAGLNSLS